MVVPEIVQTSCMTIEVLKNQWFSWGSPMTQENHVASAVAMSRVCPIQRQFNVFDLGRLGHWSCEIQGLPGMPMYG